MLKFRPLSELNTGKVKVVTTEIILKSAHRG